MQDQKFEKLEDFIKGKMNPHDREMFEAEIADNEALSLAYKIYKEIEEQMDSFEKYSDKEEALKKTLQKLNAEYFQINNAVEKQAAAQPAFGSAKTGNTIHSKEKAKVSNIWKRLAVAALFIGVIALGIFWLLQANQIGNNSSADTAARDTFLAHNNIQPDTSPVKNVIDSSIPNYDRSGNVVSEKNNYTAVNGQKLFADNFKPDVIPSTTDGPLEEAFDYYANQQYAKAIEFFNDADLGPITRDLDNSREVYQFYIHYFTAMSYLASSSHVEKAISELKTAAKNSPTDKWKIKSEWYLALAYLKVENISEARKWLLSVANNSFDNSYREKAATFLEKLN